MIRRIDPNSPIIKSKQSAKIQEVEFLEIETDPNLADLYSKKPTLPTSIQKSLKQTLDEIDQEFQRDIDSDFAEELETTKQEETSIDRYLQQAQKQEALRRYQRKVQDNLPRLPVRKKSSYTKRK